MHRRLKYIISLFFVLNSLFGIGQTTDTLAVNSSLDSTKKHSPKLAMLMSAVVPGTGQVYNKKYWKVPIIYIGGGALLYSGLFNHEKYTNFRDAYNYLYIDKTEMPGYENYTLEQLQSIKNQYRRYRDMSFIGLGVLYILNVVDAAVDGYLYDYDISDNLSLRIEPNLIYSPQYSTTHAGFQLNLNF